AEAAAGVYALKGEAAFAHFSERAFANQTTLSRASYEAWASESAVDAKKFRDGLSRRTWQAKVDDDERLAHTLGAFTVPVSFLNGVEVPGAEPLTRWQSLIDEELKKARAAIEIG